MKTEDKRIRLPMKKVIVILSIIFLGLYMFLSLMAFDDADEQWIFFSL